MLNRLRLALRSVFQRRRLDREMQLEMELHLARSTERLAGRGLNSEAARQAARREFGNVDSLQEQGRDARGARWIESFLADLRFGFRHLAKTPISTVTIIVLLALGIGFNSALFTLIYSFEAMPPHGMARNESLVRIRGLDHNRGAGRTISREFSYPEYREYAVQSKLFSAVAAWTSSDVVLGVGDRHETLHSGAATYVTPNYFQVLGVRPVLGAGLPTAAPDNGAPQLVGVISHAFWEQQLDRAPDVLGRTISVNEITITVVGVAPPQFVGARTGGSPRRVWLPLNARPLVQQSSPSLLSSYDSAVFSLAARLRSGVEASQTLPIARAIAARAAQQSMQWRSSNAISADVVTLIADNYYPPSGEAQSPTRFIVLIIPLLILAIPCVNVSSLLVGLAAKRQREIAVRLSLGAGRGRIVRQLVTESILLALAAGALGLFVIWILLQLLAARLPEINLGLRWPAVAFTSGIAIATGILFGTTPALHATRVSVSDVLKNAANAVASTRSRLQSGLVITQIALTQPLLIGLGAILLVMLADLRRLPAPTHNDRILVVSFNSSGRDAVTEQQRADLLLSLQRRFAALPGVIAVVPQQDVNGYAEVNVHPADRVNGIQYQPIQLRTQSAPPGFFDLMGFPFVLGRAFDRADQQDGRALVIRGDLARRLWGSADPIGRRLVDAGAATAFVVTGVVDEMQAGLSGTDGLDVFVPKLDRIGSILVRTRGRAEPLTPLIRATALEEAPLLPVTSVSTLATIDRLERLIFRRVSAGMLGGGLVALFLSAIGLYAVVSFAVNQRTREIGIRTALGAESRQVVELFFVRGMRLTLVGLLIGLVLSIIVVRVIMLVEGLEMNASILIIAALIATVVIGVASLATWLPSRRAAQVDPLSMLRAE
ncbi:MAG: ABC transporter permease [Gemmatimonadota bacterium]